MRIASIVLMCLSILSALGAMFANGECGFREFMLVVVFAVPAIVFSNLAGQRGTTDGSQSVS